MSDDILENVVQMGMVCIINQQEEEIKELREQVKLLRIACKFGIVQIEYLHNKFSETGSGVGTIAQMQGVLDQTKPKD